MALDRYNEKRRFKSTPEPVGSESPSGHAVRKFVIQKHQATRLHYDLRLEFGGTLKSWAVPKGPSMDPGERRLAMHVEDHPLEYASFEGVIPPGNYGAGAVEIWDAGTYGVPGAATPEDVERVMKYKYQKGELTFELHGKRLNGLFTLVRMQGRGGTRGKGGDGERGKGSEGERGKDPWLLIKRHDRVGASSSSYAPSPPRSRSPFPHDIKPMLARMSERPFSDPGWIFEMKWDGYRIIAEIENGNVRLFSREHVLMNDRYPIIAQELASLGKDVMLDGEIVVLNAEGKPSFQLLQEYGEHPERRIAYMVFDLLYADGEDLRDRPLEERKRRLREMLPELDHVKFSEHVEREGEALFWSAEAQGLEGIMAKRNASPYREGVRSGDWLKFKTILRQEAVIGGYTEPRKSRKYLGAVILGVYDRGEFTYIGHTGGGSDEALLRKLKEKLVPLERKTSPFRNPPKPNAPVHWVEPELVCEVKFQEWTKDGVMRQPILLGLREDKRAKDVVRETASASRPNISDVAGFTHPEKVFWPADGITKGDLLAYYLEVAPFLLPYLKDRPMSLHRYPDGIEGTDFFQKDVPDAPPDVRTESIPSESQGKDIRFVIGDSIRTLAYLVQSGCIDMNPWNSRIGNLDRPDYLVLDLDPEEVSFSAVVEAAHAVKAVLDEAGAAAYCKTSGARGLHVYVPLGGAYTYEQARLFAELIAVLAHRKLPELTSLERSPSKRIGKVYIDYPQNKRGATTASVYSVRPRPGATVSTPLRWDEVVPDLDPAAFTLNTVPDRLAEVGDLWAPVLGKGIDLEECLKRLNRNAS